MKSIITLILILIFTKYILCSNKEALFEFKDSNNDTFIFKLTDKNLIDKARKHIKDKNYHVSGTIIKSTIDYNPNWKFYIDPQSIKFFHEAKEVCDSSIKIVNDKLDDVGGSFLPKLYWCPWSSILTKEINPPKDHKNKHHHKKNK